METLKHRITRKMFRISKKYTQRILLRSCGFYFVYTVILKKIQELVRVKSLLPGFA